MSRRLFYWCVYRFGRTFFLLVKLFEHSQFKAFPVILPVSFHEDESCLCVLKFNFAMKGLLTIGMLVVSNIFMTFGWNHSVVLGCCVGRVFVSGACQSYRVS